MRADVTAAGASLDYDVIALRGPASMQDTASDHLAA